MVSYIFNSPINTFPPPPHHFPKEQRDILLSFSSVLTVTHSFQGAGEKNDKIGWFSLFFAAAQSVAVLQRWWAGAGLNAARVQILSPSEL